MNDTAPTGGTLAATPHSSAQPYLDPYLSIANIEAVRERIAPHIRRTPLLPCRTLGQMTNTRLSLKCENLQRTGSFKARGALNAVLELTPEQKARGVVTFSAGNHGQGLAFAATQAGAHCTVFMAENAVLTKVEAIRNYGAEIQFGSTIADAVHKMETYQQERDAVFISPFAHKEIIAGQATVALEILEDDPDVEEIVLGIGGGGLASGVSLVAKMHNPNIRVIGVEPFGAATMTRALEAGKPVPLDRIDTIADGLGAPFTADLPLSIVRQYVDDVVLVSDDEIAMALKLIMSRAKQVVEPAAAAPLAALLTGKTGTAHGTNTVAVLSGGNIDLERLRGLL
jgi:threonine dehydratase